jgi:hypothetical protein
MTAAIEQANMLSIDWEGNLHTKPASDHKQKQQLRDYFIEFKTNIDAQLSQMSELTQRTISESSS